MTITREAAKRLCAELDKLGLTPMPHRNGKVVVRKDHQEQAVVLRPTNEAGDGDYFWFWVWGTDEHLDKGVELGQEGDLARRLSRVMSVPDVEGPNR